MSMKFLSGLQDLLGLYDSSAAPNSPQSPSTPIPPTSPSLYSSGIGRTQKKTIQEINCNQAEDVQIRRCSHEKTVHFAENLITGYSEPPHSPFPDFVDEENIGARHGPNPEEILASYKRACEMTNVVPNPQVVKQIGYMHRTLGVRQELLSLKGERVSYADMEALEAVFKMVQFEMIDLEYTFLEDDALVSLAEMLEYYDSTLKLNLSFNRNVTGRGWAALFRVLRIRARLVFLNLRYTTIDCSFTIFCRILRTQPNPVLTCLHLENVSLSGKNLTLLSSALKSNTVLRELFLGENNLQPSDGEYIYQMIIGNTSLQMLDLRNNELADYGLNHICEALKNKNTMAQSALTALVMWNNRITHDSMQNLALALIENHHLETLNIGSNELGLEGISKLKYALAGNSNLHRLGLQQTSLNCQAAIVMAECLADNNIMIRVDLRENPNIGSAGLLALHSAMKMNTAITNLNLDEGCIVPSSEKVREYQEEFSRYFGEIREFCERNKKAALERMAVRTTNDDKHVDEVKSSDEHTSSDNETTKSDDSEKKSDERAVVKKTRGNRFCRSASLTCQETITDIPERIRQMSGSTHSLDEATHPESVSTIKNKSTAQSTLGKVEWGSLPAIPQAVKQEKEEKVVTTSTPVVRKMRRFSVSPTSSTFSINSEIKTSSPLTVPRPHCLSISIPEHDLTPQMSGPMSAPTSSSLPLITSFQNSTKVKETVHEEPEPIVVSTTSGDEKEFTATLDVLKITEDEKLERERKSPVRETEEDQETSVRLVVSDLVSYVVYEETQEQERKASLLLGSHPDPKILRMMLVEDCGSTPGTPSRIQNIAEELSEDESDDLVVQSVVRGLVRDVLKSEKEALRQVLELRRKQHSLQSTSGSS